MPAIWGAKVTGWGFVLFCAVAVTWIISGLSSGAAPIAAMNAILLLINGWGVWQYLLSPKNRAKLTRLEQLEAQVESAQPWSPGYAFPGVPKAPSVSSTA